MSIVTSESLARAMIDKMVKDDDTIDVLETIKHHPKKFDQIAVSHHPYDIAATKFVLYYYDREFHCRDHIIVDDDDLVKIMLEAAKNMNNESVKDAKPVMKTPDDIENRFTYHAPQGTQTAVYEAIRSKAKEFATYLVNAVPDSLERREAINRLDEVVMWANAGVSRHAYK